MAENQPHSDQDIKFERTVRRMLETPPKPHKPVKNKQPQSRPDTDSKE